MPLHRQVRRGLWGLGGLAVVLALSAISPDTSTGYVGRQALFQLELLYGRVPLARARASGDLTAKEVQHLDWIPEIQAFGDKLGLAAGKSYVTINPTWHRTIYNLSACDPVSFRVVHWRFPIVGTVPYLGYFRARDARHRLRVLRARGYDVYVRTAGAYSTLGWFSDPVLPQMLHWSDGQLANTLLHERTHATLWIPGSVNFNESFANFVGNEAELRYLVDRYGADSPEVAKEKARREDYQTYRKLMQDTYQALQAVYTDPDLDRGEKLRDKALIFAALPERAALAGFHREDAYLGAMRRGPWNNARMAQFRTYNTSQGHFAALLEQEHGDLRAFIDRVGEIARGQQDPYAALARAVGADPLADAGD